MNRYIWLLDSVAEAIHEEQLVEHGGLTGARDIKLLQSALGRPQNLLAYGSPDIADLAAAYGYGLAQNHLFNDGNKRTAFVVTELFLNLNGHDLIADDASCVLTMLKVASGHMSEEEFAAWTRASIIKK